MSLNQKILEQIKKDASKVKDKKIRANYQWLIETLEHLNSNNKDLTSEIRNLKAKTRFKVYEENLSLINELNIVKKERDEYKAPFMSLRLATPDGR